MAVLQDSLQRQGDQSLWEGPPAEERKYVCLLRGSFHAHTATRNICHTHSAAEVEMMEFAVAHCIDRLQMLERMHKTVEAALAVMAVFFGGGGCCCSLLLQSSNIRTNTHAG